MRKSALHRQLAEIGAKGGAAKSEAKTLAARANGKLGGKPAIEDEFSSEPDRRKRYQLRKAAKQAAASERSKKD